MTPFAIELREPGERAITACQRPLIAGGSAIGIIRPSCATSSYRMKDWKSAAWSAANDGIGGCGNCIEETVRCLP